MTCTNFSLRPYYPDKLAHGYVIKPFIILLASNTDAVVPESEKLYMEGRIVQKLECRPYADNTYYRLKSESIRKASMPQRQVQQLEGIVQCFKPVSDHAHNVRICPRFIVILVK